MNSKVDLTIYDFTNEGEEDDKTHPLLPKHPFRMIIAGGSGCGKTVLLMNLLCRFLTFDRLYLYSRHLEQPKYQQLLACFEDNPDDLVASNDISSIVSPEEMDSELRNVVVIDDMITAKDQTGISEMYVRGRHANASVIYLT